MNEECNQMNPSMYPTANFDEGNAEHLFHDECHAETSTEDSKPGLESIEATKKIGMFVKRGAQNITC